MIATIEMCDGCDMVKRMSVLPHNAYSDTLNKFLILGGMCNCVNTE